MKKFLCRVCCLFLCFPGIKVFACSTISWHSTNIQLLQGNSYKIGDRQRTIVTLEHANKWCYGDFYTFVDHSKFENGRETTYAEFTPRISLSSITDKNLKWGAISDVFFATQLEKGKDGLSRYMFGVGTNIDIPGFSFFKANLFNRNNPDRPDNTWQIYLAWKYPLKISDIDIVIEGYADIFGEEGGNTVPHQSFVPRFLVDIGPVFSIPAGQLQVGIEWQYWHNKFGINGVTESVPQMQVKWTF